MSNIITIQKINDIKVNPVPNKELDGKKVKGGKMFKDVYSNIFLCAKKKSGKTSAVFKILKECAGKDTNIIVFCSTINKDHTYKAMKKYFEAKGNNWIAYTSIKDEGEDQILSLVKHLQEEADEKEREEEEREENKNMPKPVSRLGFQEDEEEDEEPKKRKSKYIAPEYIILLDDLSTELKNKSLVSLLKMNRHFKAKIIISSQYLNDLLPESRKQIDIWLIFKGQPDDKLEAIYRDADLDISLELFKTLYHKATEKMYSFLYVDTRNNQYRRNFSDVFNIL